MKTKKMKLIDLEVVFFHLAKLKLKTKGGKKILIVANVSYKIVTFLFSNFNKCKKI
jgi:16S rRNA A1518/A1519 N6-dimethyltransferase RsmA/KsgA/DIM1 with predicted DNA glycosylase/AP lyase activity